MIIVFGASGFIGTYLIDALCAKGRAVIATDLNDIAAPYFEERNIAFRTVDITQPDQLDCLPWQSIEAVVHLACVQPANVSEREYDSRDYARVNILGTLNILESCRRNRVHKILYTCSHRNTQGMWAKMRGTPIQESDGRSVRFTGDYAMFSISESAAADCVEHYTQAFGIEGIVFRLPPVYGYGPHTEIFREGKPLKTGFQVFIENAERGDAITLWGDAEAGRDIVYVKDVAAAMCLALDKPGITGLFNISSGRQLSLKQQAEAIVRVFAAPGRPSEIRYDPSKPNQMESYVYSIEKARSVLGWQPKYSFDDMLVDYEKERTTGRFNFLIEKRRQIMQRAVGAP